MIFSSFRFLIFFPIVLILYYSFKGLRYRQTVLLLSSYVFYASWNPKFLTLIIISTIIDYFVGKRIPNALTQARKRGWLCVSICANLGILCYFKYAKFFVDSFQEMLSWVGIETNPLITNVFLPVGISFYTFQTMSYSLDIYREKIKPNKNLLEFALFVAFFPQLVAGPIVRAVEILPQIKRRTYNRWDDVVEGINRFIQGFTKKVLIADNIAPFVDQVFANPDAYDGLTIWLGSIGFAVQVYCDFSGYSDMAIGSARLIGFRLPENFKFPFTAMNVADFWRRWHITLYSFMRDYLYISLGGSRVKTWRLVFNVAFTMTLVGFWHGANWQFIVWGFYNGMLIVSYRLVLIGIDTTPWFKTFLDTLPGKIARVGFNNILFFIGLAIFRCPSIQESFRAVLRMMTFSSTGDFLFNPMVLVFYGVILAASVACELSLPTRVAKSIPFPIRCLGYALLILVLVIFGPSNTQAFVYFQF